jgi:hypothetical protein
MPTTEAELEIRIDEPLTRVIESIDIPAEDIHSNLDQFGAWLAGAHPHLFSRLSEQRSNSRYVASLMGMCVIAMALSALAEILDSDDHFEQALHYLLRDPEYRKGPETIAAQLVFFAFANDAASIPPGHPFHARCSVAKSFIESQ